MILTGGGFDRPLQLRGVSDGRAPSIFGFMNFQLTLPPQISFGRGAFETSLDRISGMGSRLLIVHGRSARSQAERIVEVTDGDTHTLVASGEPELDSLRAALEETRAFRPDAVVAIGGGSVLDLGKALAALVPSQGDPLRHLEGVGNGEPLTVPPLPIAAVPTTSGTGSEATRNAVIGVPEAGVKVSLRDVRMVPSLAVVDPALTESAPAAVKLASGLDAVTQVIEPYLSRGATPFTDALCRDAIPRGLAALRRLVEVPDAVAHDDMALVSLTGGIALANAGLGAVHGLAGVLGGRTGAPHGALCGRLLVPVLTEVLPKLDDPKAQQVRNWIGEVFPGDDPLAAFEDWIDAAGLMRLGDTTLTQEAYAAVAGASGRSSSMRYSPVDANRLDLLGILERAT